MFRAIPRRVVGQADRTGASAFGGSVAWLFPLSYVGTLLGVVVTGALAHTSADATLVAASVAVSFVPYALLCAQPMYALSSRTTTWLVLGALAVATVNLWARPLLSDDVYRYLWDGRVSLSGVSPYRFAPDDPALFPLRDVAWTQVNHPEIRTIYPPLAQVGFAVVASMGLGVFGFKLVALLGVLVVALCLHRVARRPRAAVLFACHPLVICESALAGHWDVWVGAGMLAFSVYAWRGQWVRAVLGLVAATGLKLLGLAALPLLRRRLGMLLLASGLIALTLAPQVHLGADAQSGLGQYAQRWEGNAGGYRVLAMAVSALVDRYAEWTESPHRRVRLPLPASFLDSLVGSRFDPFSSIKGEKKDILDRTLFPRDYIASLLTRALAALLVMLVAYRLGGRTPRPEGARADLAEPMHATRDLLLLVLLLSPQVHPWYLLWILPLELAVGRVTVLVWSAVVVVSYGPLSQWQALRLWAPDGWALGCQYLVVAVAWLSTEPLGQRFRLGTARMAAYVSEMVVTATRRRR